AVNGLAGSPGGGGRVVGDALLGGLVVDVQRVRVAAVAAGVAVLADVGGGFHPGGLVEFGQAVVNAHAEDFQLEVFARGVGRRVVRVPRVGVVGEVVDGQRRAREVVARR